MAKKKGGIRTPRVMRHHAHLSLLVCLSCGSEYIDVDTVVSLLSPHLSELLYGSEHADVVSLLSPHLSELLYGSEHADVVSLLSPHLSELLYGSEHVDVVSLLSPHLSQLRL